MEESQVFISFLAGRPVVSDDTEFEKQVFQRVQRLKPTTLNDVELVDKLQGNWRLVFTTSDQIKTLKALPGSYDQDFFECIDRDEIQQVTSTKAPLFFLCAPVLLSVCLIVFPFTLQVDFVTSFLLTAVSFGLLASCLPVGLFTSRQREITLTDGVLSSRLEREVLGLFRGQFSFTGRALSLHEFLSRFRAADGSKDPLFEPGSLYGWRLIFKPFCLHLLSRKSIRRDKVVCITDTMRVMLGGDSLQSGDFTSAVHVYVKV